jgi:serine phosphatase RsbU (regulator of sigma subunit)
MYRSIKRVLDIGALVAAAALFGVLAPNLTTGVPLAGAAAVAGLLFIGLSQLARLGANRGEAWLRDLAFVKGDTRVLGVFVDRLRFCFTTNDLIKAVRDILEYTVDSTVLLVDMPKRYSVYNSPTIIGSDPAVFNELVRHYDSWRDGVYFFDDKLDLVSEQRRARGFFVVRGPLHFYCFMRFVRVMETDIFAQLYAEYVSFLKRNETIEKMFSIAAVSKEWNMVADTQRSFLPKVMPTVKKLELAEYFKPLVNVSGDYYDVLPIDEDRTLMILGDVSGKGLAAALVMGIVVNTVRIIENKTDLAGMVKAIDAAIKGMRLQDKYTVLFLGLVDTKQMAIRYVNASMADPLIISETRAGRQIRRLGSNCSLVGILELADVAVAEAKLFPGDVILAASDGVSEVANAEGEMLGDSERWIDFVTDDSAKPIREFVDSLADLVASHAGPVALRDDVTVLAAKVTE